MKQDVMLAAGQRTAFGNFDRSLKDVPLTKMAIHTAKASLNKVT